MFSGFVFASEFDRWSEECGGSVPDTFIAVREGLAGGLEKLEFGVIIWALDEMNNSRQPPLLHDCLVSFGASSLTWYPRIACGLLHAFFYKYSEDLKDAIKMLRGRNLSLISKNAPSYFTGDSAACWIRLSVEKRSKTGKCKGREQRDVSFDGGEKQGKDVGLSRRRMEVGTVRILGNLLVGV